MAHPDSSGQDNPRRSFRRRLSCGAILSLALLALFVARRGWDYLTLPDAGPVPEALAEGNYSLVRVVDGDTIIVRVDDEGQSQAGEARVRLIGVDAPESVQPDHPVEPWLPEASAFTREFLSRGRVELQFDRRRKDRYERFLAYVSVEGRMLNEELVRAGLARAVHYPGDSPQIARRLREAEQEARREERGIWAK